MERFRNSYCPPPQPYPCPPPQPYPCPSPPRQHHPRQHYRCPEPYFPESNAEYGILLTMHDKLSAKHDVLAVKCDELSSKYSELLKKHEDLFNKYEELHEALLYAPGGPLFQEAKKHFEENSAEVKGGSVLENLSQTALP